MFPRFSLISQNVDDLYQAALSRNTIEFHGNIMRTVCSEEGCVVEINPQQTSLSDRARYALHDTVAQLLPALVRALRDRPGEHA